MASQLHTGSGDNVVNKYIINNSLDIDSIEAIAKEFNDKIALVLIFFTSSLFLIFCL